MTNIGLVANDQLLAVTSKPTVAAGDVNSVKLHVDFSEEWNSYAKSAVFFTLGDETPYEKILTNDECLIPAEVLVEAGILYIGIRGVNSNTAEVKTSTLVKYKIKEGAPEGTGTAVEPTASVYQQLLSAYEKTENALAVERARINRMIVSDSMPNTTYELWVNDNYGLTSGSMRIETNGSDAIIIIEQFTISDPGKLELCSFPEELTPLGELRVTTAEDILFWYENGSLWASSTKLYLNPIDVEEIHYSLKQALTPSELSDIRVGADGTVYGSAGEAVRAQGVKITVEPIGEEPQAAAYTMRSVPMMASEPVALGENIIPLMGLSVMSGGTLVSDVDGVTTISHDGATNSVIGLAASVGLKEAYPQVTGDIWYMGARIACEKYYWDDGAKSEFPIVQVYARTADGEIRYLHNAKAIAEEATDYFGTFEIEVDNVNGFGVAAVRVQYMRAEYAAGRTCSFSDMVLVNLTEAYGAGNEPTAEEYHAMLVGSSEGGGDNGDSGDTGGGDDSGDSGNDNPGGSTDVVSDSGYKLIITTAEGTETLYLYQGQKGEDGKDGTNGKDGKNGVDGISPTINVEEIEGGHRLTITDKNGEQTVDLTNAQPTDTELREEVTDAIGTKTTQEVLVYDIGSEEGVYEYQVVDGAYSVPYKTFNAAGANGNGRSTEMIPVKEGEVYQIAGSCSTYWGLVTLFDENQKLITVRGSDEINAEESYKEFKGVFSVKTPYIYTVPATIKNGSGEDKVVAYIVFSTSEKTRWPLQVIGPVSYLRKVDDAIANEVNPIKSSISDLTNTLQNTTNTTLKIGDAVGKMTCLHQLIETIKDDEGNIITNGDYEVCIGKINNVGDIKVESDPTKKEAGVHTTPFRVSANEIYHVWGKCTTYYSLVAWYDEQQNFIASMVATSPNESKVEVVNNKMVTVPEKLVDKDGNERKVAYMACSTTVDYTNPIIIKKEVIKYTDVKEHVSDAVEDLSTNKLNKVLISPNGSQWILTITDDGIVKTVKIRDCGSGPENVSKVISLPDNLPVGKYTLRYEDKDGKIPSYLPICTLEVTEVGQSLTYEGLIAENCAPQGVTGIGIYKIETVSENGKDVEKDLTKFGEINLGFLEVEYPNKLYSFAAISDVHIGQGDSVYANYDADKNFTKYTGAFPSVLDYFKNNDEVEFVTICGDMVDSADTNPPIPSTLTKENATEEEVELEKSKRRQLQVYKDLTWEYPKPIYVVMGNHETVNLAAARYYNTEGTNKTFDEIKEYYAQYEDDSKKLNQDLYYSFEKDNDVFIMLGIYGTPGNNDTFSLEQLNWLYRTLEDNRNKRCFLYLHFFPRGGSGDAVNCYGDDGLHTGNTAEYIHNTKGKVFLELMKHYKNVIYFHGHTHANFTVQECNAMNTLDKIYGRYSVHIPSLTWPTYPEWSDAKQKYVYGKNSLEGQGYIVDVYENGIGLRGIDFEKVEASETEKFMPIATYYLDTVLQNIEANSFKDDTGLLNSVGIKNPDDGTINE